MSSNLIHVIVNKKSRVRIDKDFIKSVSEFSLAYLHKNNCEISVVLEDDSTIRELNQQYRGINRETDVLSFSSNEVVPETGNNYIGDVILSLAYIKKQAKELKIDYESELANLIIHGIMHLLGYDHQEKKSEQEMFSMQGEILGQYFVNNGSRNYFWIFKNAFNGLYSAFKTEKNFKVHLVIGGISIILGYWFKFSSTDWGILILTISSVLAAELINTALENLVDLVSPEYHHLAKKSKDIGAAAVLLTVFGSIIIGFLLFLPGILRFIESIMNSLS